MTSFDYIDMMVREKRAAIKALYDVADEKRAHAAWRLAAADEDDKRALKLKLEIVRLEDLRSHLRYPLRSL